MYKKKYSKILIISDMDGTLLNSNREVSKQNEEILKDFVHNGGLFTVATGRDEISVSSFLNKLPINIPVIVYNGAEIYDYSVNKPILNNYLDNNIVNIIKKLQNKFYGLGIEIYSGNNIYILNSNSSTAAHVKRDSFIPIIPETPENIPSPWKKVILAWEPDKLKKVHLFLKDINNNFSFVYSQEDFIELLNKNANKGYALLKIKEFYKDKIDKIIGIGDNPNDFELLKYSDIGISVSNAHPVLKNISDFSCCHHNNNIMFDVIDIINNAIL